MAICPSLWKPYKVWVGQFKGTLTLNFLYLCGWPTNIALIQIFWISEIRKAATQIRVCFKVVPHLWKSSMTFKELELLLFLLESPSVNDPYPVFTAWVSLVPSLIAEIENLDFKLLMVLSFFLYDLYCMILYDPEDLWMQRTNINYTNKINYGNVVSQDLPLLLFWGFLMVLIFPSMELTMELLQHHEKRILRTN